MASRPLPSRLAVALTAAAVLLGGTACLNTNGPVTPSNSTTATASPGADADPTATPSTVVTTATGATTASSTFPGTARLYAEAVLLAWRTKQFTRAGQLVTPTVLSQLQTTANLDPNWSYVSCQGAAGSTYCVFLNADGDAATLRLDNQLVGRANAVTELKLDETKYSNNAVEYVKAFVEAWRNANTKRMAALANGTEVDYFTHYTPPGTYSTCATLSGTTASVRIYNADGVNYTLTVSVMKLGGKNAITGHVLIPAACP